MFLILSVNNISRSIIIKKNSMEIKNLHLCKVIDLNRDQTDSWKGHRMDRHTGRVQTFNLSYHMINSDGKSQSYNSKYAISAITSSYVCKALRSIKVKCKAW